MKIKSSLLFIFLLVTFNVQAEGSKVMTLTPGSLSEMLSPEEKAEITELVISGELDVNDFQVMRDEMPNLAKIDLSRASIAEYDGDPYMWADPNGGWNSHFRSRYKKNELPKYAFYDMRLKKAKKSLKTLILPLNLTSIGEYALAECDGLEELILPAGLDSIAQFAFTGRVHFSTLPENRDLKVADVTGNNYSLKGKLFIPASVRIIDDTALAGCRMEIEIDKDNSHFLIDDGVVFDKEKKVLIHCQLNKAGNYNIPNTVSTIMYGAFQDCRQLSLINIPSSVFRIWFKSFFNCSASINVEKENDTFESKEGALYYSPNKNLIYCPGSMKGDFIIPDSVKLIVPNAFSGCEYISSITIPQTVKSIGDYAFENCTGLKKVWLPDQIREMKEGLFFGCTNLETVNIPENVYFIDSYVFKGCIGLKSIYSYTQKPIDIRDTNDVFGELDYRALDLYYPKNSLDYDKLYKYGYWGISIDVKEMEN